MRKTEEDPWHTYSLNLNLKLLGLRAVLSETNRDRPLCANILHPFKSISSVKEVTVSCFCPPLYLDIMSCMQYKLPCHLTMKVFTPYCCFWLAQKSTAVSSYIFQFSTQRYIDGEILCPSRLSTDVILSLHFLFSQFPQPRHASFSQYSHLTLTLSQSKLRGRFLGQVLRLLEEIMVSFWA